MKLHPLTFHPVFKQRVWGGRNLERLYHKPLPPNVPIGESWEICDHDHDLSIIANGPLAGQSLRWLMQHHRVDLLGDAQPQDGRFPLLIKILDAEQTLSVQVHPPKDRAIELGGEPKTEMWYIADARPGAELYVGLRNAVTRQQFEQATKTGEVAECLHRLRVQPGDAMFLPSGRVHAIGGGLVIFEVQQNSDTTYRVFDWNRTGLDGKPRELHIRESLASIDFEDAEPQLIRCEWLSNGPVKSCPLVNDPLFSVTACELNAGSSQSLPGNEMTIVATLTGRLTIGDRASDNVSLAPGQFCLIPACVSDASVKAQLNSRFLSIRAQ